MADQQFCEDCFKGVVQDETPTGSIEIINDVEVYVSKPAGDYAKDKAVILASGGIVLMYPPRVNMYLIATLRRSRICSCEQQGKSH